MYFDEHQNLNSVLFKSIHTVRKGYLQGARRLRPSQTNRNKPLSSHQ